MVSNPTTGRPSRILPPGVTGAVRATIHLSISRLVWVKPPLNANSPVVVLVRWWGESAHPEQQEPLKLFPPTKLNGVGSPPEIGNPSRYTHTYQVRSKLSKFDKYLNDAGDLLLEVCDHQTGARIGTTRISGLRALPVVSPLIKSFAVRTVDRTHVADLAVAIHFQPIAPPTQKAYRKRSKLPSTLHSTVKSESVPAKQGEDAPVLETTSVSRSSAAPLPPLSPPELPDSHSPNISDSTTSSCVFADCTQYTPHRARHPHSRRHASFNQPRERDTLSDKYASSEDGLLRDVLRHLLNNANISHANRHHHYHHGQIPVTPLHMNPCSSESNDYRHLSTSRRKNQHVWLGIGLCNQSGCSCLHSQLSKCRIRLQLDRILSHRTNVCLINPMIYLFQVERKALIRLAQKSRGTTYLPIEFIKRDEVGSGVNGDAAVGVDPLVGVANVDIDGICQSMAADGDVDASQPNSLYDVIHPTSNRPNASIHITTAAGSYDHVIRVLNPKSVSPDHKSIPTNSNARTHSPDLFDSNTFSTPEVIHRARKSGSGKASDRRYGCSSDPTTSGVRVVISSVSAIDRSTQLYSKPCYTARDEYYIKYEFPFIDEHVVSTPRILVQLADNTSENLVSGQITQIQHTHTHPAVVSDQELKDTKGKRIVLRLWRRHPSQHKQCTQEHVVGCAVVDLSALSMGIGEISGWYNMCDEHCHVIGQLKVHIHPRYVPMVLSQRIRTTARSSTTNVKNIYNDETKAVPQAADDPNSHIAVPPSALSHVYATFTGASDSFLVQKLSNTIDELDRLNQALVAMD
eukprot:CFRG1119T1